MDQPQAVDRLHALAFPELLQNSLNSIIDVNDGVNACGLADCAVPADRRRPGARQRQGTGVVMEQGKSDSLNSRGWRLIPSHDDNGRAVLPSVDSADCAEVREHYILCHLRGQFQHWSLCLAGVAGDGARPPEFDSYARNSMISLTWDLKRAPTTG